MKTWCVYVAYDQARQRVYVGQTSQTMKQRINCHIQGSKRLDSAMANHILEHGANAFVWTVVGNEITTRKEAVSIEAQLTHDYIENFGRDFVLNDGCGDASGPSARAKQSAAMVGDKHHRYDHTTHTFTHPEFGDMTCTQRELTILAELSSGNVSRLVHGQRDSVGGWRLKM